MSENHNYFKVASVDRVKKADAARAVEIYTKQIADAQHWTFSMVGALPPKDELLPLLERTLGALPRTDGVGKSRTSVTPLDLTFPKHSIRESPKFKMIDENCQVVVCWPVQFEQDDVQEKRDMQVMGFFCDVFETRLVERLRFQDGLSYSPSVFDVRYLF